MAFILERLTAALNPLPNFDLGNHPVLSSLMLSTFPFPLSIPSFLFPLVSAAMVGSFVTGSGLGWFAAKFSSSLFGSTKRISLPPRIDTLDKQKPDTITFHCACSKHTAEVTGELVFCGLCHCADCRIARTTPVHHGIVVRPNQIQISNAKELVSYRHSDKRTTYHCSTCFSLMYNTNEMGMCVLSAASFLDKQGRLPRYLQPQAHIHYGERVLNIPDHLPKFLDLPKTLAGSGHMHAESNFWHGKV